MSKLLFSSFIVLFCAIATFSCTKKNEVLSDIIDSKEEGHFSESEANILFIGNSLTYTNDLPKLLKNFAFSKGKKINVTCQCLPNYALIDHWGDGKIQNLLNSEKFTHVIIQQGPSSQEEGRIMLLEYGAKIKELCDANKSKLAFYMVWPARSNYGTFDGVIKNYTDAAKANNAILCPVGLEWRKIFDQINDFSFYGTDDFHPSLKGSINAAEVIYKSIFE
jgi:hypothetical protein